MTYVTQHAAQRWCERVDPRATEDEAMCAIASHDRAITVAAGFGCHVVRLANHAKLILTGDSVVTVLANRKPWAGHRSAGV